MVSFDAMISMTRQLAVKRLMRELMFYLYDSTAYSSVNQSTFDPFTSLLIVLLLLAYLNNIYIYKSDSTHQRVSQRCITHSEYLINSFNKITFETFPPL